MRRTLALLLLLLPIPLLGQTGYVTGTALDALGNVVAGATISVCPQGSPGIPCSPVTASTVSNGQGAFSVGVPLGTYTVTVFRTGIVSSSSTIVVAASNITVANNVTYNGAVTFNGNNTHSGTETFSNINNIIWVCNSVYACTDAGLQAAQNTLTSGGTIIIPPGSGPTISNTVNINNPNVTIMGMGPTSSIQVALAGDVFNVTNSRFRLHDLEIGLPTTTRTGAIIHASSSGAVIGNIYNLDIVGNASSTNNGHFFLLDSANANQWNLSQIYMPRGTTWTSAFKFSNGSGVATASGFKIQGFIGGASFSDAGIIADGAIDTLQVLQSSWNNDIGGGKAIDVRNTVSGFINPRFIYFTQVSPEAVTGTILNISAGRQVHYNNSYCANTTTCIAIGAGAIDTDFSHNTIATIQQSMATIAAGALRTNISYNDIQDTGQQTSNTYDIVSIAANATDITVAGNIFGCAGSPFPRYGVNINSGTSTRVKILDNNFPNSCMGTAGINNSGSGADIIVRNNTEIQNDGPIKLFEISAPPTFANQDICYGDSSAHAIKCSFNNGPFGIIATSTLTLKKGSGGGNYTNATTSYTVADSTNLCYTVTIPTGWKLGISASGALSTATAAVVAQAALTDNAACSTANAGILVETAPIQGAAIGVADAFALNWVITGDGASHNIAMQFKTSNAADTASLINSSATITPTMKFELMPSN